VADRTYRPSPVRVGVDVTLIADVDAAVSSFGQRYVRRLFTDHEIASCGAADPHDGTSASLAARFAAKEAVLKVLEPSGSRPEWRDIEIVRRKSGACRIRLHGRAVSLARARGVHAMSVSLSHEAGLAVAVVAAACDPSQGLDADAREGDPRIPGDDHRDNQSKRKRAMTMSDETTQCIRDVLSAHGRLPVDVNLLSEDDDLFQAGMTSHASVNVMLGLEDALDVEFPEAMLRKSTFASIGALRRALAQLETLAVSA
jgi:phosphopantetheine--protein transferase-like protein